MGRNEIDTFEKIKCSILSINNSKQIKSTEKLIELFNRKHNNKDISDILYYLLKQQELKYFIY